MEVGINATLTKVECLPGLVLNGAHQFIAIHFTTRKQIKNEKLGNAVQKAGIAFAEGHVTGDTFYRDVCQWLWGLNVVGTFRNSNSLASNYKRASRADLFRLRKKQKHSWAPAGYELMTLFVGTLGPIRAITGPVVGRFTIYHKHVTVSAVAWNPVPGQLGDRRCARPF